MVPAVLLPIGLALVAFRAEHIKELPPLIWALLGCYAVWLLRDPLVAVASRIESFKVKGLGLEVRPAQEALNDALIERNVALPGFKRKATMDRRAKDRVRLVGAEILWVDDVPSGNRNEARALQFSGAAITFAVSTDEALSAIADSATSASFDLILSDIKRGNDDSAGPKMIKRLREVRATQPLVFYSSSARPPPLRAFGTTSRPDVLIELVPTHFIAARNKSDRPLVLIIIPSRLQSSVGSLRTG